MYSYSPRAINVSCCRHTSGDPSHATSTEPFGGRQGDAQPVTVAVPPEPFHRPVVQTGTDQPIADAHAADEPPVAGRRRRATAAAAAAAVVVVAGHAVDGPEQHVERGRRPALDV